MASLFDEIGYWSEMKLEIIREYASQYSLILSKQQNPAFHHVYIDAFAGPGKHISRTTGNFVSGSPKIALDIKPPFKEYYFIDINGDKVAELEKLVSTHPAHPNAHVLKGDCNARLLTDVLPNVKYENYRRGLCLLDPYGLDLNWAVMETAGQMKTIDMFLNFPVMDINRNVLWKERQGVNPDDILRMNAFWGDDSWQTVAYTQVLDMFGDIHETKEGNKTIAEAFKKRLKEQAGFTHVSSPLPMRNSNEAVVYYLFFASQKPVAKNIIDAIFEKYRNRRI
jgi:three-Cys-motif partner protein